ncbi:DUF7287 family protein [Halobacterium wangiae]|uniref:DUF7287 family protein n=1 Tax=Halobacterium wangiae TaxID=2902623 RepID=UPI001E64AFE1|nr:hypothetical protein [Halobacterium wangiae]
MTRAQTTMDFAAGVSIFLVTVAFAFAFVPGIITPFTGTGVGDPVTANRLADGLASDRLADADAPFVLDSERVASFFGDETDLADRLSVPEFRSVNVTLKTDSGVATVDGDPATAGSPVPSTADVTVAWRSVSLDGQRHELVVRVW